MDANYHEADYRPIVDRTGTGRFLQSTSIEIISEPDRRRPPAHVLFDFDGTLSLIREGWPDVMVPMMVEILRETGTAEPVAQLQTYVHDFVMELNGKQTIFQMMRLADEVRRRGGLPEEPLVYKRKYNDRLMQRIAVRRESLRLGTAQPETMLVPGTLDLLQKLRDRGVRLYLASGTDESYVREEVQLLGLAPYFDRHVYGARDDYQSFSKAKVIERILAENDVQGGSLLGFGDGYVEIQNIKEVGGTAVAVASDERGRSGRPDPWKRERLISVGADLVIPDFRDSGPLLRYLWNETEEECGE